MEAERAVRELQQEAGFLLSRVGTAVQAGFKEVLADGWQLRPLHFLILTALNRSGGASQQELCQATRVDSGNMVELIDRLEQLGYVARHRDQRDRRRYQVALTDDGRAAFAAMLAAVHDYDARFLAPLTPAEQRALVATLGKLYATTPEGQGRPWPSPVRSDSHA